ncbi:MAG: hypothetical protein ACT4OT_07195 [Acidobacteriota bacterium]
MPDLRESLQRLVLDSYRDEYKDVSETWRNLEGKAQGAVAIAGIFVAGAFAYIRDAKTPGSLEKVSLAVSIFSLMASVLFAIWALKVRKVPAPPWGSEIGKLVQDLLAIKDDPELAKRVPLFTTDQVKLWETSTNKAKKVNQSKANWLLASHVFLVLAILAIGFASLAKLWL